MKGVCGQNNSQNIDLIYFVIFETLDFKNKFGHISLNESKYDISPHIE